MFLFSMSPAYVTDRIVDAGFLVGRVGSRA